MIDIKKINGYEIIDFFNNLPEEPTNTLNHDYNMCRPFIFETQMTTDEEYNLMFSVFYDNWGEHQIIKNNLLTIKASSVSFELDEVFEGNGSDDTLTELLTEFLKNHTFNQNTEEDFYTLIKECDEGFKSITYSDKKALLDLIKKLKKAYTLMK